VKARVLLDTYSYYEKSQDPSTPLHTVSKDETITVSAEEFDRGVNMVPQALAKASDTDARTADEPLQLPENLDEAKDDELRAVAKQLGHDVDDDTTRDELVGMVAAAPGYERPQV
jgi:hypothetical protein